MLYHYLSTAFRHFRQHKVTIVINVSCLALGLACFLLASVVVESFEQRDRHHEKADRTFVVTQHFVAADGGSAGPVLPVTPLILSESLRASFPGIEHIARASSVADELAIAAGETRGFAQVRFADAEFLDVFDLPLIQGDRRTALRSPRSAIVSEALATRVFGTTRVHGRTLLLNNSQAVTITGVVASLDRPSHISVDDTKARFYFEVLASMDTHVALLTERDAEDAQRTLNSWNANGYTTYVALPDDASLTASAIGAQFPDFVRRHIPAIEGGRRDIALLPISRLTEVNMDAMIGTDRTGVSSTGALLLLGTLVLLVSCVNYANLASAQAVTRYKEVALRRVVGARSGQVLLQHLIEGFLLSVAATVIALSTLVAMLSVVPDASYAQALFAMFERPSFWVSLTGLMAAIGVLGSLYPALTMLRVRAAHSAGASRAKRSPAMVFSILVGIQFAASAFLMVALLVVGAQNRELRRAALGAGGDRIVVVANDLETAGVDPDLLRTELSAHPGIAAVSRVEGMPWSMWLSFERVSAEPSATSSRVRVHRHVVDYGFFHALSIPLLAGRDFERSRAEDVGSSNALQSMSSGRYNVIVDRTLARQLGWDDPRQAVGKTIYNDADEGGPLPTNELRIIGVAEDAALKPLGFGAKASFFVLDPVAATTPVVRLSGADLTPALAALDEVWSELAPDVPLKRRFSDEQFAREFHFLNLISTAFAVLTGFALLIAVMGLIAMSLHVADRRRHEIGVRKTLGASVTQILVMLLKHFSKPIVIANLAAWPVVFVAMQIYLSMFTQSAALSPLPFVTSLLATLCIAWLSVGAQAFRAARVKPAAVLRYE